MGEMDRVTRKYMSDNRVFADVWKGHRDLHSMLRLTPGSDRIVGF